MTTGAMWGWIGGIAGGIIGLAGGASYLQQAAGDCRAVFRHHSGMQAYGQVHSAWPDQGKYPMVAVLSGSQY